MPRLARRLTVTTVALGILTAPTVVSAQAGTTPTMADLPQPDPAHVATTRWDTRQDFKAGRFDGTRLFHDSVVFAGQGEKTTYTDPFGDGEPQTYESATWTSPEVTPGFDYTELVSSWNAHTPAGTWIQVTVSGTGDDGQRTKEYVLARWADDVSTIHRTSVDGQGDDMATVYTDTLATRGDHTMSTWRLKLTLYRKVGSHVTPSVDTLGAFASNVPDMPRQIPASPLGGAEGTTLDVPTYSQEIHIGEYPEFDGGGEAWCSPTSTSMVLAYWQQRDKSYGPRPADYAWVNPDYADPWVDHAASRTYDYTYEGAGNWPFNTAYAGTFGLDASVTRLRSLTEAEQFISAGIPLVLSVSFTKDELDGAGYGTNGHLMVLVGFDEQGNPVMNDPASHLIKSNDEVRVTYDRQQLESAWSHSGRIAYVIHPRDVALPPVMNEDEPNW